MKIKVKIKKSDTGTTPVRGTSGAAGWDLYAAVGVCIQPQETAMISTGIFLEIPPGYEMQVRSRSGLASKGIVVANSPGTIDSDYRGEVKVLLRNGASSPFTVNAGDRIAQGVFAQVPEIEFVDSDELSDSDRGVGGFGSTGLGNGTDAPRIPCYGGEKL